VPAGDQVAVPAQDGVGAYQQSQAAQDVPRQPVQQRHQKESIARLEPGLPRSQLPLQHRDLVAQGQNLDVFVVVAHGQQSEHREGVRDAEVCQS